MNHRDLVRFDLVVKLPAPQDSEEPLTIEMFQTRMGIFEHHLADLHDRVYFKSIDLATALAHIHTSVSLCVVNFVAIMANLSG